MSKNFGLSDCELSAGHTINPEQAAHNIALAYITASAQTDKLYEGENAIASDVLSLSQQYVQAYNYAYNLIVNKNEVIKHME